MACTCNIVRLHIGAFMVHRYDINDAQCCNAAYVMCMSAYNVHICIFLHTTCTFLPAYICIYFPHKHIWQAYKHISWHTLPYRLNIIYLFIAYQCHISVYSFSIFPGRIYTDTNTYFAYWSILLRLAYKAQIGVISIAYGLHIYACSSVWYV